jgi:hypothetical protein
MYELGAIDLVKSAAAALVASVPLGLLGAYLLPARPFASFFTLAIALLMGLGAGTVISEAVERTGGKRGRAVQLIAVVAVAVAGLLRLVFGGDLALFDRDVAGALAVVAGAAYGWNRLR